MGNANINSVIKERPGSSMLPLLEQVVESNPIPNLICSQKGKILLTNTAVTDLLSYSRQELLAKNVSELLEISEQIKKLQKKELSAPLQLFSKFLAKDGSSYPCSIHINTFEVEDSEFNLNIALIKQDSKASHQSAIDSELAVLLNNTEEYFLMVNSNYEVVMFNQMMFDRLKNFRNVELKEGTNVLDTAHPAEKAIYKEYYDKALRGEQLVFEPKNALPDGSEYYHQITFKPAKDNEGKIFAVFVISKDVTEQKRAEKAIELAEQRWRFALEGSNQGVWDWNLEKNETYFSSAWKKLLGFEEHEISNKNTEWEERIHPDDKKALDEHIEKHLLSENPYYETEYRLKAKDGSYRWILARGMIISRDENGKPQRMIGTHTDITDRRNIEDKYKLLFYNNPLPMWTYDQDTLRFVNVNNAAVEHYGYSRDEFLQMTLLDIRPEEDRGLVEAIARSYNYEQTTGTRIWRHKKKNGEIIYVNIKGRRFNEGSKRHTLVLAHDVTEKVIAEQELINAKEQYATLFSEHPYPSWILESGTYRFLKVNNAAIEHYGYSADEMLNMTILDIIPPENHHVLQNPSFVKNDDHYVISNFIYLKKNGERCIVDIKGRSINYNGKKCFLAVVVDVTDKAKAEQELIESNERYKLVTQATSDVVWDWDLSSDKILFSENFENVFGWPLPTDRRFSLEALVENVRKEDTDALLKKRNDAIQDPTCTNWTDDIVFRKADGSYAFVQDKGYILRDENGKAYRAIGALRDVTEEVKKEKALIASNERFELVAQATSEVLWEADFINKRTYVSPLFKNVFGFDVDEANYFRKWPDYIHPDDRDNVLAIFQKALNDVHCDKWYAECRHRKADDTYAHIINHYIIIRNENGEVTKLVGAIKDITSRKITDEEILRTNERFHFATSATSDIIWDYDIKNGNVIWSDNYQRIMGWQLPDNRCLAIEGCLQKFHPDDHDAVALKMLNTINDSTKDIWEDEFRYQKSDGTYAYVIDRGFIIRDKDGKAERMIGAMQDISDRKYQEELQSLELRVFEVSAVPGIHFHNVLKTLITGFESLHPQMYASICLHNLSDETEILAPRLAREHCRQLRYFIEKQKDKLQDQQAARKNIIISSTDSEDWRYASDAANYYSWKVSWTLPVYHHSGDLLAFFMVFLDASRAPTDVEMNALARIRNLLRIIIGNYLSLEQIRISNERYDNVLKATHDLVWDWNLETGKFYRNAEGLRKVYGVGREEDIENVYSWMQRIHPEDHATVQKVINDILHATDQDTFDVEYRFKKDDGTYANIYDRGVIVRNKDGKPLRMIGAAQNITDRKRLEQELLQKELDKQKFISQATIDTQEEERREIGKELHDNVNQVLTTTKLYLDLSLSSPELKDELIKKSTKNIIYVINEIRQLSRSLMDPSIGDLGLIDSINDLVENINITRKLHVSVTADTELEKKLDESQKLTIFRILQEAMNNTIKYAQATSVQLNIKKNKKMLELTIVDDGVGFNPATVKKGAGLKNINNRVYLANGKLQIDSAPGKGCKIVINFPLNNKKQSN